MICCLFDQALPRRQHSSIRDARRAPQNDTRSRRSGPKAAQIHARRFGVGIARPELAPQRRVLIEALALLLIGAEVLADPCPELRTGGGLTLAEMDLVDAANQSLDFHLTELAALTGARRNCSHASFLEKGQLRATPRDAGVQRILQFSDPHLLADPQGHCRGLPARRALLEGLRQALGQLEQPADLLLISGDLCQDESWGGYVRLREVLEQLDLLGRLPVALVPGNHDHPQLLRAALARHCALAPALLRLGAWRLLLLSSHRSGEVAGWVSEGQREWMLQQLQALSQPTLVVLHHPPLPIGSPALDPIALQQADQLLQPLLHCPAVKGLVFGHVHQHWFAALPRPQGGEPLPVWGCPSSLVAFEPVQPCPTGHPLWPGARLLELGDQGQIKTTLLRWPPLTSA